MRFSLFAQYLLTVHLEAERKNGEAIEPTGGETGSPRSLAEENRFNISYLPLYCLVSQIYFPPYFFLDLRG